MKNSEDDIKTKLLNHQDVTKIKVRFNDTDAMGVVHFMNYFMYFDDGFVSFMNSLGASKRVEELIYEDIALGVKHVNITYENSAKFGAYIIIRTNIEKIGKNSITFHHNLFRESDNALLASVNATRFIMDLKKNELRDVMKFLKHFLP
ncbi:MAG: acyl-CoA thioesterase [Promethearchaeati archaeon]